MENIDKEKCLHNKDVYRCVKFCAKFIGYVVLNNLFQQNIKRDKLSVGEMPTGNTNNQATKQTSWISRYLAVASALHFDPDGNTIKH